MPCPRRITGRGPAIRFTLRALGPSVARPRRRRPTAARTMRPRLRLAIGLLLATAAGVAPAVCAAADGDELRGGGGLGLGATFRLHPDQGRGLEIDRRSQNYSFSLGVDINRFVGVELMTSQSQTNLEWRGRMIGEYG